MLRRRQPDLSPDLLVRHDGAARDVRAGARGRRDRHQRQARLDDRGRAAGKARERPTLLGDESRRLAEIERRAAADRDERAGVEQRDLRGDVLGRRERRLTGRLHVPVQGDAALLARSQGGGRAGDPDDGLLEQDEGARRSESPPRATRQQPRRRACDAASSSRIARPPRRSCTVAE